ncbi:hypothetical protein DB88DRAFT_484900 [Papiliotrema laurentii]|uniref:Uncharacterized protein n=1 Tax=Papiliotrema laurentii TaxID=5418 RepID=A0AAD9FSZ6_PAPLA|nr:hypothetical protein DB88DRAFT_484900 [Papiliotrema laurentii]
MQLNTNQTIALCVGAGFAVLLLFALCFTLYASRKAREEDREASAAAVMGRWKEIAQVSAASRAPHPTRAIQPSVHSLHATPRTHPGVPTLPTAPRPVRRDSLVRGLPQSNSVQPHETTYNPYKHVPPSYPSGGPPDASASFPKNRTYASNSHSGPVHGNGNGTGKTRATQNARAAENPRESEKRYPYEGGDRERTKQRRHLPLHENAKYTGDQHGGRGSTAKSHTRDDGKPYPTRRAGHDRDAPRSRTRGHGRERQHEGDYQRRR